jgi:hypothetical protein
LWRPPRRNAQTFECTIEFSIIRGVNELDTGDWDRAQARRTQGPGVPQVMDNGVRVGYHDVRTGYGVQR